MRLKLLVNKTECNSGSQQDLPPVDLSRMATGMLGGISVHRWLTGITHGLGLPQAPHIATSQLIIHEPNTPLISNRPNRLDLEFTAAPGTGDELKFFLYLVIGSAKSHTLFATKLIKPGTTEPHPVELSATGLHDAGEKVILETSRFSLNELAKDSRRYLEENSIIAITIPVIIQPGELPSYKRHTPYDQSMYMKAQVGGYEEKQFKYNFSLEFLLQNGGKFIGYGTPKMSIHTLAHGPTIREDFASAITRKLPTYLKPVAHQPIVFAKDSEFVKRMQSFFDAGLLRVDKPTSFDHPNLEDLSSSKQHHAFIFEAKNRYLVYFNGSCLVQERLTTGFFRSEFDYHNPYNLQPTTCYQDFTIYLSIMIYLIFTGHNPPLKMYNNCLDGWRKYGQNNPFQFNYMLTHLEKTKSAITRYGITANYTTPHDIVDKCQLTNEELALVKNRVNSEAEQTQYDQRFGLTRLF